MVIKLCACRADISVVSNISFDLVLKSCAVLYATMVSISAIPCNVTIATVVGGDNITPTLSSASLGEWTTTITDNNAATAKNNHFMLQFIVISFLKLCEYR